MSLKRIFLPSKTVKQKNSYNVKYVKYRNHLVDNVTETYIDIISSLTLNCIIGASIFLSF